MPSAATRRTTVNAYHALTPATSSMSPSQSQVCKRLIDTFAVGKPRCLNMKQLLQYHEVKDSSSKFQERFKYLSRELPTRFANILKEMQELPENFKNHYAFVKIEQA